VHWLEMRSWVRGKVSTEKQHLLGTRQQGARLARILVHQLADDPVRAIRRRYHLHGIKPTLRFYATIIAGN